MTSDTVGQTGPDGLVPPLLREAAIKTPVDDLAQTVLKMRSSKAGDRSAVNSTVMVEFAAEHRPPAEIVKLIATFVERGVAEDLARLALDAAAARRDPRTMAELVLALVGHGLPDRAEELLAIVVRRRLPRDVAELLTILATGEQSALTSTLVREFADDDGRVLVILWLRALHRPELATDVAGRMAALLEPAALAGFIEGLRAFRDNDAADAAVASVLELRELGQVASLIENLRTGDEDRAAKDFIREALGQLRQEDLCVLASRLSAIPWPEGAQLIWDFVVPGVTGVDLVDALSRSGKESGHPEAALDALAKAALIHSVPNVAWLAVEVEGRITVPGDPPRFGYDTVLLTVAQHRSVPEVFAMADELIRRGHDRVAADLLGRAESVVHQRRDGAEIAEFIDRMLDREPRPQAKGVLRRGPSRWTPDNVLRNVAGLRNPNLLMGVIAGLAQRRRYGECHDCVEHEVPERYGGRLLAELPLVLRRDQLPAVQQIMVRAFRSPKFTTPAEVAAVVGALRQAGTTDRDMRQLLMCTGARRHLDCGEIVVALGRGGAATEAQWTSEGRRHGGSEPNFLA